MKVFPKYLFLLATLATILTISCKKDVQSSLNDGLFENNGGKVIDRSGSDGQGQTILGQKHDNPYAVETIRQAYNLLYGSTLSTLSANHLYVRFLPQSPDDVGKLLKTGLEFLDFPQEYSITKMGEHYHDPSITDSTYTWEYTIVPYDFIFPNVQYEVLETLALVPEGSKIAEKAFELTDNEFEIPDTYEPNPALINGRFDFTPDHGGGSLSDNPGAPGSPCGCPTPENVRNPSGCVTVFDNMVNQWDAVREVKVLVSRTQFFGWAFHHTAITSGKGCWDIKKKFKKKINIWVKYESPVSNIKVMNYWLDLWGYTWPYQPYIGEYGGPNFNNIAIQFDWTNTIGSKKFRNWIAATANNSVFEFQNYASAHSLPNPPGNLKILITPWGKENKGSAPMLDKSGISQGVFNASLESIAAGVFGIFDILTPFGILPPLGAWIAVATPDITLNLNISDDVNADDVRNLLYHELAHAQHYTQVGPDYWNTNVEYVASNKGYGAAGLVGSGRCAIIEMWGYQNGYLATHPRYGLNHSNQVGGLSLGLTTWQARAEIATYHVGYIAFGWQYDLQDNNAATPGLMEGTINGTTVPDAVSGFTEAQIFSTMTFNVITPHQQRLLLLNILPPGNTSTAFDNLANAYGL